MRCDSCENQVCEGPAHDQPYPEVYCAKDRWEGLPPDEQLIIEIAENGDPWSDCPDYKEKL